MLDRIDRGAAASDVEGEPRLAKIRQALELLHDGEGKPGGADTEDIFARLRCEMGKAAAAIVLDAYFLPPRNRLTFRHENT